MAREKSTGSDRVIWDGYEQYARKIVEEGGMSDRALLTILATYEGWGKERGYSLPHDLQDKLDELREENRLIGGLLGSFGSPPNKREALLALLA